MYLSTTIWHHHIQTCPSLCGWSKRCVDATPFTPTSPFFQFMASIPMGEILKIQTSVAPQNAWIHHGFSEDTFKIVYSSLSKFIRKHFLRTFFQHLLKISPLQIHKYRLLLWFWCEMFSRDSSIWTLVPPLVAEFGKLCGTFKKCTLTEGSWPP